MTGRTLGEPLLGMFSQASKRWASIHASQQDHCSGMADDLQSGRNNFQPLEKSGGFLASISVATLATCDSILIVFVLAGS
jgi:hypothetical protein